MRITDIIQKKKDNIELSKEEIYWIIDSYLKGDIKDYQISALLMAICFNGLSESETLNLTMAMRDSGDILDLSSVKGIKVDKHSSGGVGDKTTLALAPIVAACNVPVAKMSGRGLGHTGGTIDKLECFPGFSTSISEELFFKNVNEIGVAIAAQTANLAPADKKIYALRDTTATVDQSSLIASSIMSKKLASGSDAIVLDVKCGSGAFMKNLEAARELASKMVKIGTGAGKKCVAFITNMDEPLGYAVGNTLEVIEAHNELMGKGPADFHELVINLAGAMVYYGGKADSIEAGIKLAQSKIDDGSALTKFYEFITAQGGNIDDAKDPARLLDAKTVMDITSNVDGYISAINAEEIGNVCMSLGGGRLNIDDTINMSVGLVLSKKVGDYVKAGESLATVYASDEDSFKSVKQRFLDAYSFSDTKVDKKPCILDVIGC